MIVQPLKLTLQEIREMQREQLVETLLSFTDYFSVRLTAQGLEQYSTEDLRDLLFEIQERYRGKSD